MFFTGTDLRVETFQKGDGTPGVKLVCRCSDIKFASDGQPQQQAAPRQQPQQQAQRPQQARQPAPADDFDQDIPF